MLIAFSSFLPLPNYDFVQYQLFLVFAVLFLFALFLFSFSFFVCFIVFCIFVFDFLYDFVVISQPYMLSWDVRHVLK